MIPTITLPSIAVTPITQHPARIDVPQEDGATVTQFYSPSALYCLTPVSEAVARAYAQRNYMRPVSVYDLALPRPTPKNDEDDDTEF